MFIVGNRSTGIRSRLLVPTTVTIRHATTMKSGRRIAKRDILVTPRRHRRQSWAQTIGVLLMTLHGKTTTGLLVGFSRFDDFRLDLLARLELAFVSDNNQVAFLQPR